jgi:peptidoglycan/LPS O-acetylase OafA/YrhL
LTTLKKESERFRRIVFTGDYKPEIDGLRFIAVFLVVVLLHFGNFMRECQALQEYDNRNIAHLFVMEGLYGVPIFFMISGFVLSLPFAKTKMLNDKKLSLKTYYLRRISRIEPPYLVSMTLYFILKVWILHYTSAAHLFPHYLATIFYSHNIIYGYSSEVMGIAWSLEVEAQFYLLAPLIANIFLVKNLKLRRGLLLTLMGVGAAFSFYWRKVSMMPTLLDQGCYFMAGILLADMYLLSKNSDKKNKKLAIVGLVLFVISLFVPAYEFNAYLCIIKIYLVFLTLYIFITNTYIKKILSNQLLTLVGGMCYSIYLVHMGVFGLLRHKMFFIRFTDSVVVNIFIHAAVALTAVMILSSIFFIGIEKPTMNRYWYRTLFRKYSKA